MTKQEFEAEILAEFKGGNVKIYEGYDESWRCAKVGNVDILHRGKRARPPGWKVGHMNVYNQPTLREAVALYRSMAKRDRDRAIAQLAELDAAVGEVTP